MGFIVAIDGEAGSGKSSTAKKVAEILGFTYIDTGAMFRCVTLELMRNNIGINEIGKIEEVLNKISIDFRNDKDMQRVILNGVDVSEDIRTKEVDDKVAEYATVGAIREKLKLIQQEMGRLGNIIMEGRDIGTVIFPNADVKLYIEVSEEERAKRRYNQNLEKGITISYEEILANIQKRHKLETEREIAPLVKAEDAILLDTTNITFEETTEEVVKIINKEWRKKYGTNITRHI